MCPRRAGRRGGEVAERPALDEAREHRLAVLAKGVVDGLERLAGLAEKELVREDLADPRLRARAPLVPILVDERADAGLDARVARELDDVLDVPERPQDEEVRGAVDPGAFGDRGAPAGDAALCLHAAPALEPVDRILAVRLDEGVGDGVDEVGVRVHVVLSCENATPARPGRFLPGPLRRAPSARSPRLRRPAGRAGAAKSAGRLRALRTSPGAGARGTCKRH